MSLSKFLIEVLKTLQLQQEKDFVDLRTSLLSYKIKLIELLVRGFLKYIVTGQETLSHHNSAPCSSTHFENVKQNQDLEVAVRRLL